MILLSVYLRFLYVCIEIRTYNFEIKPYAFRHDGLFVRSVEKELMNLVEKVQWMAIAKHCHSFPAMKKDKRQVTLLWDTSSSWMSLNNN